MASQHLATVKGICDTLGGNRARAVSAQSRDFTQDQDFKPPLYNVWTYAQKSSDVSHFGNSEQRILDNLLYLYTEPFDIVVDGAGIIRYPAEGVGRVYQQVSQLSQTPISGATELPT